eukprot:TRINITY_DN295_c0_g1_i1.p1 TRINITY_DN295_c0_g1~~TRINITY_DN295_c0_g1_i1.p1  ORF type:complete len:194 (-),score=59.66 TRINITY_DN295_c0_g1_i1:291-872(-)
MSDKDTKKEDKKDVVKGLDASDSAPTSLILVSKDKKEVTVQRRHAYISSLLKNALESDTAATKLEVQVTGPILELIADYMTYHKGQEPAIIEKPLRSKHLTEVCADVWDAKYIDTVGQVRQQLYDLILGANYMDIKSLLHLGCAKVASLIKGLPLEKIREVLDPKFTEKKEDKKDDKEKKDTTSSEKKEDKKA